jgi:putative cell wall-binding protein
VIEVYRSGAHPTPAGQLWQTTDATRPGSGCIAANDDGPWFFGGSASASFVPTQTGTYYFRVRPGFGPEHDALPLADGERLEGFARGAGPYTVRLKVGSVTRLALADTSRVQTAVEMSREAFPDTSLPLFDPTGDGTVVVANGWNYPDAIAGSTLAGVVRGPLLITHPDRLDGVVAHEIRRLGAKRVFVLGSSAAVSTAVKTQLEAVVGAGNVLRVSGPPRTSRVDTAIAIAKRAKAENPSSFSKLALICNGWSFADALAASPVAAYGAAPILLTHGSVLDTSVADAIRDLGVTDALVVGSTGAVSRNVENALKAKLNTDGKAHVLRIGGQTRYATAAAIATWATGRHGTTQRIGTVAQPSLLPALDWRRVGFATGVDYPDALGGGVFCGLKGHPLLLTPGASVSPYILDIYGTLPAGKKAYFSESSAARNFIGKATRSYVLGGEAAVTGPTLTTLDLLLGLQP